MRVIKEREKDDDSYFTRYTLDGIYGRGMDDETGILLLFFIATSDKAEVTSVVMEGGGDIGGGVSEWVIDEKNMEYFQNGIDWFLEEYQARKLETWRAFLTLIEDMEEKYVITGKTSSAAVSVRSSSKKGTDIVSFLKEIETEAAAYYYDPELIEKLKKWFKLTQVNAVRAISKLNEYKDIAAEFYEGMKGDSFCFPDRSYIKEEGYMAKDLFENYPLSELGAYNYLIYLREDKEEALSDLEKGLPRK